MAARSQPLVQLKLPMRAYLFSAIAFLGLLALSGCHMFSGDETKAREDIKKVVQTFLEMSVKTQSPEDRAKLKDLCVGQMYRAFENMSDESFELAYLAKGISLQKLEFVSVTINKGMAKALYKITVKNDKGSEPTIETNQREIDLIENRGKWFLENISPKGKDEVAFTRGMIF